MFTTRLRSEGTNDGCRPRSTDGIHVRTATTIEEVEAIRGVWTELRSNPNTDIDFYLKILRSRSIVIRPHVLVLYQGESPLAMLVGRIEESPIEIRLGYANLFKLQARILAFVYGGQVGDFSPENSKVLFAAITRSLREGEIDIVAFRFIPTSSSLYKLVSRPPGFLMRDHFPQRQTHWVMLLPENIDDIYLRISKEHRAALHRKARKLIQEFQGNVRVHCFRHPAELDHMFRDIEEVARNTYHRGLGVGFVDNSEMRERMKLEAEKTWLRAYVLYLGDQPAAFWMGNVYTGKFFSSFVGYDDAFRRHSPGTFLLGKVFEELHAERVREIDFGQGDAEYKQRFGTSSWEEASINIFASTLAGLRISAFRTPALFADRIIRGVLKKTQALPRIKKLWRNRAIGTARRRVRKQLDQPGIPPSR